MPILDKNNVSVLKYHCYSTQAKEIWEHIFEVHIFCMYGSKVLFMDQIQEAVEVISVGEEFIQRGRRTKQDPHKIHVCLVVTFFSPMRNGLSGCSI